MSLPPERHFGLLFIAIATLFGLYLVLAGGHYLWTLTAFIGAVVLALVTVLAPRWLAPFNRAWFWLGNTLGRIISPIVMAAIFFLLLTPLALVLRVAGRDELRLKLIKPKSHWIARDPPGPSAESFKNQF